MLETMFYIMAPMLILVVIFAMLDIIDTRQRRR